MDDISAAAALMAAAAACILVGEEETKLLPKKKRSCWVKPYRIQRSFPGDSQHLTRQLTPNIEYKKFLGMDEDCFQFLLSAIMEDIKKQDTMMRIAVTPEEKLAATLRFLATGESLIQLESIFKLSQSFLSRAIFEVCDAIYLRLKDEFLKFPTTEEEWSEIEDDFNLKWNFPNCIGALDIKHIAFTPLKRNAKLFVNAEGFPSVILLAVADAYSRFVYIDVGCNGKESDVDVLSQSNLHYVLLESQKYLPEKKLIGYSKLLPCTFVADNAFPLMENVMTPFPHTTTDISEKTYNYRLGLARQTVEHAFDILTNRFKILGKKMLFREDKVNRILLCCCVLHNFLISKSHRYVEETQIINQDQTQTKTRDCNQNRSSKKAEAIRKKFAEYFNNEGKI